MRFDLTDLRLFLHVVEAGSITAGAGRAHLALQSASERIRGMERELGVPLLRRTRSGVHPTDAGRTLAQHARAMLRQMEQMRSDLGRYGGGLRGHVRLLCNTSALAEYLPDALARYLADHPRVSVKVEEKLSREIADAIRAGTADIGIVADSVDLDGLAQRPFREDRLALVVPPGSPLAGRAAVRFEEVVDAPFVGLVDGSALQEHVEQHARQMGRRLNYRVQLRSFDAVCRMIQTGIGVGVVPAHAAARLVGSLDIALVELDDAWARRALVICARDMDALPDYLQDFIARIAAPENP